MVKKVTKIFGSTTHPGSFSSGGLYGRAGGYQVSSAAAHMFAPIQLKVIKIKQSEKYQNVTYDLTRRRPNNKKPYHAGQKQFIFITTRCRSRLYFDENGVAYIRKLNPLY
tara:strand:+ start:105 stop:434 length:330 start_codon:yes stop_codon:yes gene_type:complete